MRQSLLIEAIEVCPDVVEARVRVPSGEPLFTSAVAGLSERATELLPGLARHTCENGTGHGILAELAGTEVPHVLEHVALELMALAGSPRRLTGETVWDFARDGVGVFRIRLGYDDDVVALGALRAGAGIVDWLMGCSPEEPHVAAIVHSLQMVRGSGHSTGAPADSVLWTSP